MLTERDALNNIGFQWETIHVWLTSYQHTHMSEVKALIGDVGWG